MAVAAYGYLVIAIVAFLTPAIRNEAR
jgi:hypothetical protein